MVTAAAGGGSAPLCGGCSTCSATRTDSTDAATRHPWPADMLVQRGGTGIVFEGDAPAYRTAFVETFPRNPADLPAR